MKLAVVGGGWAGIAAAVRATQAGHAVTLYEMAPQCGGRARAVSRDGLELDNGQHILIGAYTHTLGLMAAVGVDLNQALRRLPLVLRYPDGRGLHMPRGPAWLVFGLAVARAQGWAWRDKLSLMRHALGWAARGFRCTPSWTVERLCLGLSPAVRELLVDPLCVAALNTPAAEASAVVFLRVLRDSLFAGPGSSDLLLPRQSLAALLPQPAGDWLRRHGASLRLGQRVSAVRQQSGGWQVDGEPFDAVVLACSATEAARLAAPTAPQWAAQAAAFGYEPIITVYVTNPGSRLPAPMTAMVESADAPAQFVFDHGALGGEPGRFAFVVSGARKWVDAGADATAQAVLRQAQQAFPPGTWKATARVLRVLAEKRATFRCVPGLQRPTAEVAAGLYAAGDYVAGPYPATLEGAVRSGESAVTTFSARAIS